MGFFGVVFYALTKHDFTVEQSRLTSDPVNYDSAGGIQKIQAVKICTPFCPSGIKASAKYLIKDIEAMKKVWSNMKEAVQHNFVRLYDCNTSIALWYSMEAVMSGLMLENFTKPVKREDCRFLRSWHSIYSTKSPRQPFSCMKNVRLFAQTSIARILCCGIQGDKRQ